MNYHSISPVACRQLWNSVQRAADPQNGRRGLERTPLGAVSWSRQPAAQRSLRAAHQAGRRMDWESLAVYERDAPEVCARHCAAEPRRLREWRKRRLLTQRELAKRVGMTVGTVNRIERGVHRPRLSTIRKLAEALDLDPDKLVERDSDKTLPDNQLLNLGG